MEGRTNLPELIRGMKPKLNDGAYVFATLADVNHINRNDTICEFKEKESITVVIEKKKADALKLRYAYVAAWITLTIHSSLDAVGLTATFAAVLANNGISSNVIAGYYHDHIFVQENDADKAIAVLLELSKNYA